MRWIMMLAMLLTGAVAQEEPPWLVPLVRRPTGATPDRVVQLRKRHAVSVYAPTAGAKMRLVLRFRGIGKYQDTVSAWLDGRDDTKVTVGRPEQGLPTEAELTFVAPRAGAYTVRLDTGANAAELRPTPESPWLTIEASVEHPRAIIGYTGRLYFYVPRGTAEFAIYGSGASEAETLRIRVFDPQNELRATGQSLNRELAIARVLVPDGLDSQVWYFVGDKVPDAPGTFEDCRLWLSPEVPQQVAVRPDGLLVPFVHGLRQRPRVRDGREITIAIQLNTESLAGERLAARVVRGDEVVAEAAAPADQDLALRLPGDLAPGDYRLTAELHGPGGVVARGESPLYVTNGVVYVGGVQPLIAATLPASDSPPSVRVRHNLGGRAPDLPAVLKLVRTAPSETPGGPAGETVWETRIAALPAAAQEYPPPADLADGHYQWQLAATGADGVLIERVTANFHYRDGRVFAELPPPPGPPVPIWTPEDRRRGLVTFVPEAVDALPYNDRPTPATRGQAVAIRAAQGEIEPGTFGLWSADGCADVRLTVSALAGERSEIPPAAIDLRVARHWPQRRSWNSPTYRIIPELLDRPAPFDIEPAGLRQIWLTVRVPDDAAAGTYRGSVTIRAGDRPAVEQAIRLEVFPFKLWTPPEVHWGLYSDSSRYRGYSEAKVANELGDIRAHGITTLMLYPLSHSAVEMVDGKLSINSTEFERIVDQAVAAGLGPPWVMSLQALPSVARRLSGTDDYTDPKYAEIWRAVTRYYVDLAARKGWGRCVWHAVDEPWREEALRQATTMLGYFKDLGLETFTTAGPVPPEFDAVLDVRCYSRGYLLRGPEQLSAAKVGTKESGDELWWYGTGCYTGQDGNVLANRWGCGYLYWLSGALGEWSWTFVRPKDDPFDDFDGAKQREAKDACTAYPSPGDEPPLPTLQWEGIREGIDDYRYLYTLKVMAGKASGTKRQAAEASLAAIDAEIRRRWVEGGVTSVELARWRDRTADAIVALVR